MTNQKDKLKIAATDLKNFLIDYIRSKDNDYTITDFARAVGIDPSTMNRWVNTPRSHLPAYLIPFLPDELRTALLHYLDNNSGNPIKGKIDTSDLDGSIRDECDGIVENLGQVIKLERTMPGIRQKLQKTTHFQNIGRIALRAEQEISNRE